jgi:hypothetical protein
LFTVVAEVNTSLQLALDHVASGRRDHLLQRDFIDGFVAALSPQHLRERFGPREASRMSCKDPVFRTSHFEPIIAYRILEF